MPSLRRLGANAVPLHHPIESPADLPQSGELPCLEGTPMKKTCKYCYQPLVRTRNFWWLAGFCSRECWEEWNVK